MGCSQAGGRLPPEFGYNSLRIPLYLLRAGWLTWSGSGPSSSAGLRRMKGLPLSTSSPDRSGSDLTDQGYADSACRSGLRARWNAVPDALRTFEPSLYYPVHPLSLSMSCWVKNIRNASRRQRHSDCGPDPGLRSHRAASRRGQPPAARRIAAAERRLPMVPAARSMNPPCAISHPRATPAASTRRSRACAPLPQLDAAQRPVAALGGRLPLRPTRSSSDSGTSTARTGSAEVARPLPSARRGSQLEAAGGAGHGARDSRGSPPPDNASDTGQWRTVLAVATNRRTF